MKSSRRIVTRLSLALLVSTLPLLGAVALEACGSDSTGGQRFALHTRLQLEPSAQAPFVTALGWTVTLDRALVSTGAFAYFDGTPPLVRSDSKRPGGNLARDWLGLRLAHAHPGHYEAGNALGEMATPWSADLFAGPLALADGDGVDGTYRSGRFTFNAPPVGPVADALGGHVALASGKAELEGQDTRYFVAFADLADVEKSATDGKVEGCEFTTVDIKSAGTVTVTVNAKIWFNLVDFSELGPSSADAPIEFPADSQPKIAFAEYLAQLSAYKFTYLPD